MLHKLRGSIMPGYVSLFERHDGVDPGRKSRNDSLDLDNLLGDGDANDNRDTESMDESDLESVLNARINGTTT